MAKRAKVIAIKEISEEELQGKLSEYANIFNALEKEEADMNQKITAIRDECQPKVAKLKADLAEAMEVMHFWAEKNKPLFDKKRSMDLHHGLIGFRTGTPKLKAKKGFTWVMVLDLAKKLYPQLSSKLIRVNEEMDKEFILSKHKDEEYKDVISNLYIEVVQDENFFISLKKEDIIS